MFHVNLPISEIFYSIQGEGSLSGVPSVFVRVSGCNLRCHWCDTPYALNVAQGKKQSIDNIVKQVLSYQCQHVVLTGGEPMMHPNIKPLCDAFQSHELHITIETSGSLFLPVTCSLMSISPKLSHSTPNSGELLSYAKQHEKNRINVEVLNKLINHYDYQLKFVIDGNEDLEEINQLLNQLDQFSGNKVMLMPQGIDKESLSITSPIVAELCKLTGFRYAPRLHVDLWGNTQGT